MMKIYVASSWRNKNQPYIVDELRSEGYDVYDFRNPEEGDTGFSWRDIDEDWENWSPEKYRENLKHEISEKGFKLDFDAMKRADVFIGVQPFGRSASLEMGWAAGNGKKTILLLQNGEPELMVKMLDYICLNMFEVFEALKQIEA